MLATSRCAADTMPQCTTRLFGAVNNGSLAFSTNTIQKKYYRMAQKRQWDESRSPQWRYLLSKDSHEKRNQQKKEERADQAEGELKKGISKRKRKAQEKQKENRRQARTTKKGKEILYSASPGGEKNRYHNAEFEKSFHKITTPPEIFNNNNN